MGSHSVSRCVACGVCTQNLGGKLQKPEGSLFSLRVISSLLQVPGAHTPLSPLLVPLEPAFSSSPVSAADMSSLKEICGGLPLDPLPENRGRKKGVPHAPVRTPNLTTQEEKVTWALQDQASLPTRYHHPKQQGFCLKCSTGFGVQSTRQLNTFHCCFNIIELSADRQSHGDSSAFHFIVSPQRKD